MENTVQNPFRFSSPKTEQLFQNLIDASEGSSILAKKILVELIENQKIKIALEVEDREKQVFNHKEAIAELVVASEGLSIPKTPRHD